MTGGGRRSVPGPGTLRPAEAVLVGAAVLAVAFDQDAAGCAALVAGALVGGAAHQRGDDVMPGIGLPGVLLRGLVAVCAVAGGISLPVLGVVAATVGLLSSAALLADVVDQRTRGMRRHPATRGLPDVGSVPLVRRPVALLNIAVPECLLYAGLLAVPGRPGLAAVTAVAAAVGCLAVLTSWGMRLRAARGRSRAVLAGIRRYLDSGHPEVLLYAGDGPAALHEIAVWLPTMERLSNRVVLLMRSRDAFEVLPPTTLTVLCVPGATELLALPLQQARAALFVSNIGNNIHVLRVPGLRSAFIGHGDSDKSASANPYAKVYDEIWVAGEAGRDRYLKAGIGVRTSAIVTVGRPQLELVREAPPVRPAVPTLLYAPTWEGWNQEQDYSSVVSHGEAVVRAVLDHPSPLRLIYRPHPYTGRRDAGVAAAHWRIVAMISEANKASGVRAATVRTAGPATESSSASETERAAVQRGEELLAAGPQLAHVVLAYGTVPLISSMNAASALVTDVSSVLTDFLQSDKPVAVCNTRGSSDADFVAAFPSAAAAAVVPPGEPSLSAFCDVVTGRRPDLGAAARAAARRHLLGGTESSAMERFDAALDRLAARAHKCG